MTTSNIFADNCDAYWAAGLPVMPLKPYTADGGKDGKPTGKEAFLPNWQSLQSRMPNPAERHAWKIFNPTSNIGLPLGPESGLVAIDVDTDDPVVLGIIQRVLPPSPWKRIGRKGMVLVYKYEGQPIIRIKYRDAEGKMQSLIEMLGAGSQIVMPPSIHPNTAKPYTENKPLVDVLDQVRSLPPNVEVTLRKELEAAGFVLGSSAFGSVTDYVSNGNRDNHTVSMAGLFARNVLKGEKTLKEACGEIEVAIVTFMARCYGDDVDPKKGPQKLIEFLIRDVTGPKQKALPKGWDNGITDEERKAWGLEIFNPDNETLDHKQIIDYFNSFLEEEGVKDNVDQFTNLVKRTLAKMAANQTLNQIDADQIIHYMADTSGKRVTVAALRKELAALKVGPVKGDSHAEVAQLCLSDLQEEGGEIRFHEKVLWQWTGSHWSQMREDLILQHIIKEYGELAAARRASDHKGIMETMKNMATGELRTEMLDGINFVNGFLTDDLEMKEHSPNYGMTYTLGYRYDPDLAGKCPRWQKMLIDYWGDDPDYAQKVCALGEVMALTMFGKMTQVQSAVCLYGVAHSGKSRIMEIMQGLVPAVASVSLPPTMWGDKFGPADLVGKLLNFAGELSEFQQIDSAKFKQIISGEVIDAQRKNQQSFNFRPKAGHWFASNHLPRSRDSSDGFSRRWLFLVFTKAFPKDERRIRDYDQLVLAEEREAIAAWAVQFMTALRNGGFNLTDPISSREQREILENELNSVRDFLVSYRDQGRLLAGTEAHAKMVPENSFVTFEELWKEYRKFCLTQAITPVGSKALHKRLAHLQGQLGFKVDKIPGQNGLPINICRNLSLIEASGRTNIRAVK